MGHKSTEEIRDRIDQHKMEMGRAGFARKNCLAKRIEDLEWVLEDRPLDGIPEVQNLEVSDNEESGDSSRTSPDTSPGSGGALR